MKYSLQQHLHWRETIVMNYKAAMVPCPMHYSDLKVKNSSFDTTIRMKLASALNSLKRIPVEATHSEEGVSRKRRADSFPPWPTQS